MAIPHKPQENFAKRIIDERIDALSKMKLVRIRDLPKRKLLKWTVLFYCGSMSIFMLLGGPLDLFRRERRLNDARILEEIGGAKITDKVNNIGTAKPFRNDYGFDFPKNVDMKDPVDN